MHPAVTGRGVAHRGSHFIPLRMAIFGRDVNLCSDAHAVAPGSDELQNYPMISGLGNIVKELNLTTQYRNYRIDTAIVIQVAEGGATMNGFHLEIRSGGYTDVLKLGVSKVA